MCMIDYGSELSTSLFTLTPPSIKLLPGVNIIGGNNLVFYAHRILAQLCDPLIVWTPDPSGQARIWSPD